MSTCKLSIIIPCFNCQDTLEEAVASVYRQDLTEPFEIVLVDDGSTDGTKALMADLAGRYDHLRYFHHEKNMGGGATRNTAVAKATGEVISCLDSDDYLGDGTLGRMLQLLREKNCDGVGVATSIKFNGRNAEDISYIDHFAYVGEKIPFGNLFRKEGQPYCSLYSVFMFTKKAFTMAGGYPTEHGFDTQGFAWRFLANGLSAYTCPNTTYFHRVNFHQSYYLREYAAGKANDNWRKILLEFFYLFNEETRQWILHYSPRALDDMFEQLSQRADNLVPGHERYLAPDGRAQKKKEVETAPSETPETDLLWLSNEYRLEQEYVSAERYLNLAIQNGLDKRLRTVAILQKIYRAAGSGADESQLKRLTANWERPGTADRLVILGKRITKRLKKELRRLPYLRERLIGIRAFYFRLKKLLTEKRERVDYYRQIAEIKNKKKIVVDLQFGGIGDCLAFSTLPRLLKEQFGVDFYLSKSSFSTVRQADTLKLCFELNPYFKGFSDEADTFSVRNFEVEKSLGTFLLDRPGENVIERSERQFGLVNGRGRPEIYYQPQHLADYAETILIDPNTISGKKFGWAFPADAFEREAKKYASQGDKLRYVDPAAQSLFAFVDMIYSCKRYVGTFSGGASIAAAFDREFSVIFPNNGVNGSNYQFMYRRSAGDYILPN